MEDRKFEISSYEGPVIKVIGDDGEITEVREIQEQEEPLKENPRYKYLGEYNKSTHPNYKPSPIFRDLKWILAYDKQVAKYPKRFKPRAS